VRKRYRCTMTITVQQRDRGPILDSDSNFDQRGKAKAESISRGGEIYFIRERDSIY